MIDPNLSSSTSAPLLLANSTPGPEGQDRTGHTQHTTNTPGTHARNPKVRQERESLARARMLPYQPYTVCFSGLSGANYIHLFHYFTDLRPDRKKTQNTTSMQHGTAVTQRHRAEMCCCKKNTEYARGKRSPRSLSYRVFYFFYTKHEKQSTTRKKTPLYSDLSRGSSSRKKQQSRVRHQTSGRTSLPYFS